jgi:hypothetical protein
MQSVRLLEAHLIRGILYFSIVSTALELLAKAILFIGLQHNTVITMIVPILAMLGLWTVPFVIRFALRVKRVVAFAASISVAFTSVFIAPKFVTLHAIGRGSDQGDCIIVASRRFSSGLWPYSSADMWSHNPMSCGPGWVGLYVPFLEVFTYPIVTVILLSASILAIVRFAGLERGLRFVTLLALLPGCWLALANGSDLVAFGVILSAIEAFAATSYFENARMFRTAALILLALSQARLPFLPLPAVVLSHAKGMHWWFALITNLVSIGIWYAFYCYYPISFVSEGPMHVLHKFHLGIAPQAIIFALAASSIGILLQARLSQTGGIPALALIYLSAVLIPISLLDLISKLISRNSIAEALAYWEGPAWITGLACLAAWIASGPGIIDMLCRAKDGPANKPLSDLQS